MKPKPKLDLRKTSQSPDIASIETEAVLSGGGGAIAPPTREKQLIAGDSMSGVVGILGKSSEVLTSFQNPRPKWLRSLEKNSVRRSARLIVVEGHKETTMALSAGYQLHSLFVCPELTKAEIKSDIAPTLISPAIFQRLAYRDNSDGIIAVFQQPERNLDDLSLGDKPFLIVCESIEKPGNLGAIVRTADGAGASAVIVCDERCDIWNPNAIRASVGTLFSTPVVATTSASLLDYCQTHSITIYAAMISDGAQIYTTIDFTKPSALVLGTEHDGLSPFWNDRSTPITIPMHGVNDSLNVSAAAAILAYEVIRQRSTT